MLQRRWLPVPNLMFAGRDISAPHMGMSVSRVMGTTALLGQAAGTGAALAVEKNTTPAGIRKVEWEPADCNINMGRRKSTHIRI